MNNEINMTEINKLNLIMISHQNVLNYNTNGSNWKSGVCANGKTINWTRALHLEIAELIDSYPWKHWKDVDASADELNAKIEATDGFHFLISLLIARESENTEAEIITAGLSNAYYKNFHEFNAADSTYEDIIKCAERLCGECLADILNVSALIDYFMQLIVRMKLSYQELYKLYIGKNALNKFRQDNGYKDGTYRKHWNFNGGTVEDNVVMYDLLESINDEDAELLNIDYITKELEVKYAA